MPWTRSPPRPWAQGLQAGVTPREAEEQEPLPPARPRLPAAQSHRTGCRLLTVQLGPGRQGHRAATTDGNTTPRGARPPCQWGAPTSRRRKPSGRGRQGLRGPPLPLAGKPATPGHVQGTRPAPHPPRGCGRLCLPPPPVRRGRQPGAWAQQAPRHGACLCLGVRGRECGSPGRRAAERPTAGLNDGAVPGTAETRGMRPAESAQPTGT